MNTRTSRILIIVGFSLGTLAIGVVVWLFFFQPLITPPGVDVNGNANVNGSGQLPNANVNRPTNVNGGGLVNGPSALPSIAVVADGGLTLATPLRNEAVNGEGFGTAQGVVFYDPATQTFQRYDPTSGTFSILSNKKFPEVQNVTWAPDATTAVLTFPDDSKIVYDFAADRQYSLPKEAENFSFSDDSKQLAYAYVGQTPDERFLVTADVNGSNQKALQKLGENADRVQVAWSPTNEVVGLFRKGAGADRQEIVFLGQNQENFKSLTTNGTGFRGLWTPDGEKLLYTVYSAATNYKPELHLVRARGSDIGAGDTSLGIGTFVDRCAFTASGSFAYCAVPDTLPQGAGPYPDLAASTQDSFVRVDLSTGSVTRVAQPTTNERRRFSVSWLSVAADEDKLYFTDRTTGLLHELRLR